MGINDSIQYLETSDLLDKKELTSKRLVKIAWFGVGASALIGEYISSYTFYAVECPEIIVDVYRDISFERVFRMQYDIYVFYSYSGDTLETLHAFNFASSNSGIRKGSILLTFSSGGKLESMAKERKVCHVRLPVGYTSRSHFPYGLAISFSILARILGLEQELRELVDSKIYDFTKELESTKLHQKLDELAQRVLNKIVLVTAERALIAVARRFVAQLNENAKHFAAYFEIPEGAHNLIVGLRGLDKEKIFNVILRRNSEEPLIRKYLDVITDMLTHIDSYIFRINDEKFSWRTLILPTIFADVFSIFLADKKNLSAFDTKEIALIKSRL